MPASSTITRHLLELADYLTPDVIAPYFSASKTKLGTSLMNAQYRHLIPMVNRGHAVMDSATRITAKRWTKQLVFLNPGINGLKLPLNEWDHAHAILDIIVAFGMFAIKEGWEISIHKNKQVFNKKGLSYKPDLIVILDKGEDTFFYAVEMERKGVHDKTGIIYDKAPKIMQLQAPLYFKIKSGEVVHLPAEKIRYLFVMASPHTNVFYRPQQIDAQQRNRDRRRIEKMLDEVRVSPELAGRFLYKPFHEAWDINSRWIDLNKNERTLIKGAHSAMRLVPDEKNWHYEVAWR